MIGTILKTVLGKVVDIVVGVLKILFGVTVDDVRKLARCSEVRSHHEEYVKRRDEFYQMVVEGTISPSMERRDIAAELVPSPTSEDRLVLEADDALYTRMYRIFVFTAVIDAIISLLTTALVIATAVGGYLLFSSDAVQEIIEHIGM